ncbi:maltose alpha-D-glucosyltransferase/ alpha-amylase [Marinitoga hydrogenitolerans DSM 16785]|uniref:Maltose alpha-D-glucosyltransferase/ alpha-amylase n=1 Tax=Marinitoga hydrogenitolerans (strain DSM 16785 / JCM 12826 / AT1271) TaxID=1122195 RepID=A0A1M4XFS9_MARH1|nr:alpha-amylase family glycosyl hydrolase [Marinitoga hydrogenitolerans]SHE92328.1 maltose alpha-D-glucosyltransferase/ alpha-amylase [Marinitoga hydrogenitolerans DSM 16785]
MLEQIKELWFEVYPKSTENKLNELIEYLKSEKQQFSEKELDSEWYKKAVIYSLYVDLYAGNFKGLTDKIDYLSDLGINTIWLLPVLDSPLMDQGFDIRDYYKIRKDLGNNEDFKLFLDKAHENGIRVIFDIAINHTSNEHPWFKSAKSSKDSPYRDYYIWNENTEKYKEARLLFKGMVNSNWEYNEETKDYYFHRFYPFQPDLNYKNPQVLIEMIKILVFWKKMGIDGFRMDAAPFLWKEEGSNCENLPQTHAILKIFRNSLDYLEKGTILVAEANLKPRDVVEYFGNGDECHAGYHFPLMPKFFLTLAEKNYMYVFEALKVENTPNIPESCRWFTFLRCHDELTLEFVTKEEREKMNKYYLKNRLWTFREGEGISGRLYELLDKDIRKVLLSFSLLFTTEGSPIIYYGDEIALENDYDFYNKMIEKTGFKDSRFLNRGPINWDEIEKNLKNKSSKEYIVFNTVKNMLKIRKENIEFFEQKGEVVPVKDKSIFVVKKRLKSRMLWAFHNLSEENKSIELKSEGFELFSKEKISKIKLKPYEYSWVIFEG